MNLSESEALNRRVRWLNHRTLAVGIISIVMLLIALGIGFSTLRELIDFFGASQRPTDFAVHIPEGLGQSRSSVIATTLMFGMAILGVWGMSTGSIRRAKCFLAFVVVLMCGIADFYLTSQIHRPIFGLTSQFERAMNAGKYEEAEVILQQLDYSEQTDNLNYLRAQIALRAKDKQRLHEFAMPILNNAELYVYGAEKDFIAVNVFANTVGTYRTDVVAAFDVALNGVPTTAVALELHGRNKNTSANIKAMVFSMLLSTAFLGASFFLAWTWRTMRRHLLNILDAGFSID
jgi:hypothetical protein